MATLIQLLQALQRECGVSGAAPATAANQPTEINRLINWLAQAHAEIQSRHQDWEFLRNDVVFSTLADQGEYTSQQAGIPVVGTTTAFGAWKLDSFRIYDTGLGVGNEMLLPYCDYDSFRNLYLFGTQRTVRTRPVLYSVNPRKNLVFGNVPNGSYTVNGEYYKKPIVLTADTDEPLFPSQFHNAIIYRAMMHYGAFEAATEVFQRGDAEFKKLIAQLEIDQLPTPVFGAPLA